MVEIGSQPTVVLDCRLNLGESVLWDESTQELCWVNIHEGQLWHWAAFTNTAPKVVDLHERVGAIALRKQGGIVAAMESRFVFVDCIDGRVTTITGIERSDSTIRLNDGRVDPAGRFVCGGMDEAVAQKPIASVYALEHPAHLHSLIEGVHCSNSICWSPDGTTFYFTDMPQRRIDAYDYDVATGMIANRRLFADLAQEPGFADGSITDAEGYLWNAQWGGGKIVRYAPNGSLDREIKLPVTNPTCLAFGGPDLDILFVTSAWFGLSDSQRAQEPHAGSLFALRPGVRGRLESRFAG